MQLTDAQVKRFVLDTGLASRKDIDTATSITRESSCSLADALCTQGSLSPDDVRRITAYVHGIPFVSLTERTVEPRIFTHIPEPLARIHNVVAFNETPHYIDVALFTVDTLPQIIPLIHTQGKRIRAHLTDQASMRSLLSRYQNHLRVRYGDIIQNEILKFKNDTNTPLTSVAHTLIHHALLNNASTIHIERDATRCSVRYRINGTLYEALEFPTSIFTPLFTEFATVAHLDAHATDSIQEGRFRVHDTHTQTAVRVTYVPTHAGGTVILALATHGSHGYTLEGLGFHGESLETITQTLTHTDGLFLIAGEATSGKTTVLYTLLDILQNPHTNLVTLEDSIESSLARVNQISLRSDQGFTLNTALRSAARMDPDVLGIDSSSISDVLQNLATHYTQKIITTIPEKTAADALAEYSNMTDSKILPRMVIAVSQIQTLRKKTDKYFLSASEIQDLRKIARMNDILIKLKEEGVVSKNATWASIPLYREPLDADNKEEFYSGSTAITEVLVPNESIRALVARGSNTDELTQTACASGMFTFVEDTIMKAALGITTLDEVWRVRDWYYT